MVNEQIIDFTKKHCRLKKNQVIIAAVSGGPDSLCMLDCLHKAGYPLVVAHFNHQIRPEAAQDARYVEQVALELGIPYVLGSGSVRDLVQTQKLSIEEAARILRYRFLFEQAHNFKAQAVSTGHTADDQVETILMHLLRGAGLGGLKGMQPRSQNHGWDDAIPLVRPLLSTRREETQQYCLQRGFNPVYDVTNDDQSYLRNRIRHELLPLLETYNPNIRKTILRSATVLNGEYEALDTVINELWTRSLTAQATGFVGLSKGKLLPLTIGLLRGLSRKSIAALQNGIKDIDMETVDEAVQFICNPSHSEKKALSNGIWIRQEDDQIYFYKEEALLPSWQWPQIDPESSFIVDIPGQLSLARGWCIDTAVIEGEDREVNFHTVSGNNDLYRVWLDADLLKLPLSIRSRKKGDRWQPLGLEKGSQKISDFFINAKCPLRARDRWPLVCSGDEIIWIPGFRPAHPFRITEKTNRIAFIRLQRNKVMSK